MTLIRSRLSSLAAGPRASRREFLCGLAAFGAAGLAGGCKSLFTGAPADFDDDLIVFLSDIHVKRTAPCDRCQIPKAKGHVAEILRMDPLPRNVLCFGDLAYSFGVADDYRVFKEIVVDPLTAAGIRVTLTMGNHDRRDAFLEVFPEYAKATKVAGRVVSVVETPQADFVLLDTLNEKLLSERRNTVEGEEDEATLAWLEDYCARTKKPFFAGAHHPARELRGISALLANSPSCYGWIHGHNHRWYEYFASDRYKTTHTIRTVGLPSTGHWGDIGYGIFRLGADRATLTCRQTEFFFPNPHMARRIPENWKEVTRDHDGRQIVFPYDK